ncbi:MAG: HAD family hydrolase [Oscillospiraceae bacterium]|nr:HAD family hydrolase [Oscillospiraceae bacterium]
MISPVWITSTRPAKSNWQKHICREKTPGKCLFLGDTCHDFEVARAVGADCILIAFGHQSRKQLESCGCPVIDSLLELPSLLKE